MATRSGRDREVRLIHRANRAAAVGRLMLKELHSWQEFLNADVIDLENLPRRQLKSGAFDVKRRLSAEIKSFCSKNFVNMDERTLSMLYEDIKAYRGLEIPLAEFEEKYATVRRDILKGNPAHLTISISLWGLQFKFPEDELAKDLAMALQLITITHNELHKYEVMPHSELILRKADIASLTRKKMFAVRSTVLCCFNLIEAYLNGLAWDYIQKHGTANLSTRQKELLEGAGTTGDKLRKYPNIIGGKELWKEPDEELEEFIGTLKKYRDSLVHPSPFSVPEKWGGYNKLRLFYRTDHDTAVVTAELLIRIVKRVHQHLHSEVQEIPDWIRQLGLEIQEASAQLHA